VDSSAQIDGASDEQRVRATQAWAQTAQGLYDEVHVDNHTPRLVAWTDYKPQNRTFSRSTAGMQRMAAQGQGCPTCQVPVHRVGGSGTHARCGKHTDRSKKRPAVPEAHGCTWTKGVTVAPASMLGNMPQCSR
jgi:hypothetical protein